LRCGAGETAFSADLGTRRYAARDVYVAQTPRALSAATALGIVALIGAILVLGLRVGHIVPAAEALVAFDLTAPRPTPSERVKPPEPRKAPAAKRKPSPRNLRNKATQVVAPLLPPIVEPPPIVAATEAGAGSAANTGAFDLPGPGQGAGGIGNGDGGGGSGGDGDGAVIGPRRISGRLRYDDLPKGVLRFGDEASVQVRYWVHADGRVRQCRAAEPSGFPPVDALACRLIEQRFRFRPARDAAGRAVAAEVEEWHTWVEDGRR
jgi:periplasmic protein TonB